MQVFIILKWSPDSNPRIQVSGVTSIVIPHFVLKHCANWNHKKVCHGFLGFKTKSAHFCFW